MSGPPVVHSDREIMSGTPVFVGTRVPFQTLLDYIEAGQPLSEFLEDFPTVSKEQAIAARVPSAKAHTRFGRRPRANTLLQPRVPEPLAHRNPQQPVHSAPD